MHDFVGQDGRFNPERITEVIAEIKAYIVALQEVTFDHANTLVKLFEEAAGMPSIDGSLFAGLQGPVVLLGNLNVWG